MRAWLDSLADESGQALALVGLLVVTLLAMTGLVVDGGRLMDERRLAQNAADAAALAGAFRLRDADANQARADAIAYAASHGYHNGVDATVEVHVPPVSGAYLGDNQYVQVVIRRQVPLTFIQVVYAGASHVEARGTAGVERLVGPYAIIALNPGSGITGLQSQGTGMLRTANGGIMVNSAHPSEAIDIIGGATIDSRPIHVVGGVGGFPTGYTTFPTRVQNPIQDPLRFLPPPSGSGLPDYQAFISHPGPAVTLHEGIYHGGIKVNSGTTVILCPGTYILANGGLDVRGGGTLRMGRSEADGCSGSELANPGVLIYNTGRDFPGGGTTQPYDQINIAGNAIIDLEAKQTGTYAGVLFFQDRNNHKEAIINGNGTATNLVGTVYIPGARLNVGGTAGVTTLRAQLIGDTVEVFGTGDLVISRDESVGHRPPTPVLVE